MNCKQTKKIYVDELCYICYEDRQVRNLLLEPDKLSVPYSDFIYDLYLTYIRRYSLKYHHLRQAKKLSSILEKDPPATAFKTWLEVYHYDEKYPLPHKPNTKKGHAVLKIGFMLQELGVLAPKEEELGRQLERLLTGFSKKEREWLGLLLESLTVRRREPASLHHLLNSLKNFKDWLEGDLLSVNQQKIEKYLQSIEEQKPSYIKTHFSSLNQTYRFLKYQKLILINPCEKIKLSRIPIKLCIASERHVEQLFRFIKNPDSESESALILTLVLLFGFTSRQLAQVQCAEQNGSLVLTFRRKPTSYGRRFYNREQNLKLPVTPVWFFNLQKRFLALWQERYEKTKKTYPHKPLLLPHHHNYNRILNSDEARERIKVATHAAVGSYIQARILRQTCGHLYSKNGDASILSRLGWSAQFAFCYTWAPRIYYSPKPKV